MTNDGLEKILERITGAASSLPESLIERVASRLLDSGEEASSIDLESLANTQRSGEVLKDLEDACRACEELDLPPIGLALLAAHYAFRRSEESEIVDLVWTGPATTAVPVRRIEQVLKQLIDDAESELLLVSFATYKVGDLQDALKAAVARSVKVKMVLETHVTSAGKISYDEVRRIYKELPGIDIYVWPLEKRERNEKDHHGTLHAKCAVADGRTALISSANLTPYALELNMEIGVLVSNGEIPLRIAQHFKELMERGILCTVRNS
jgi:hypothetical protein